MEYQVGSVADAISGKSDASASKARIVFVPKTHKPSKRTIVENLNSSSSQLSTPSKRKKVENEDNIDEPSFLKERGGMVPQHNSRELQRKHRALKKKKIAATKNRELERGSGEVAESEDDKDRRTLFVKNLPKMTTPKQVQQKYKVFGEIESVRLRCAVPEDTFMRKREAVIRKKFHEKRSNICAFVVYKNSESVQNASTAKFVMDGHRLFQKPVGKFKTEFSRKNAVFVGNLTWDAEEDDLHAVFKICGEIVDVSIIRHKVTGMCLGIAYVNFQNRDSVELALSLGDVEVKGRKLRISRSEPKKAKKGVKQMTNIDKRQKASKNHGKEEQMSKIHKRPKIRKSHGKEKAKVDSSQEQKINDKKVKQKNASTRIEKNGQKYLPENSKKVRKANTDFQGYITDKIKRKKKISKAALKKKVVAKILLSEKGYK